MKKLIFHENPPDYVRQLLEDDFFCMMHIVLVDDT